MRHASFRMSRKRGEVYLGQERQRACTLPDREYTAVTGLTRGGEAPSGEINATCPSPAKHKRKSARAELLLSGQTRARSGQPAYISTRGRSNCVYLATPGPTCVYLCREPADLRLSPRLAGRSAFISWWHWLTCVYLPSGRDYLRIYPGGSGQSAFIARWH